MQAGICEVSKLVKPLLCETCYAHARVTATIVRCHSGRILLEAREAQDVERVLSALQSFLLSTSSAGRGAVLSAVWALAYNERGSGLPAFVKDHPGL